MGSYDGIINHLIARLRSRRNDPMTPMNTTLFCNQMRVYGFIYFFTPEEKRTVALAATKCTLMIWRSVWVIRPDVMWISLGY